MRLRLRHRSSADGAAKRMRLPPMRYTPCLTYAPRLTSYRRPPTSRRRHAQPINE